VGSDGLLFSEVEEVSSCRVFCAEGGYVDSICFVLIGTLISNGLGCIDVNIWHLEYSYIQILLDWICVVADVN